MKTTFDFTNDRADFESSWTNAALYEEGFRRQKLLRTTVNRKKGWNLIKSLYPNAKAYILGKQYIVHSEYFYCCFNSIDDLTIFTKTEDDLVKYLDEFSDLFVKGSNTFNIRYASLLNGNIVWEHLNFKTDKIEEVYPELYPDIDIKYLAEDFGKAREKILLLYGIPGVGKTSFIRYLITNFISNKSIVYVKDPMVLNDSRFWLSMSVNKYDYLILDDISASLSPRADNATPGFVSELLSYTSGILEQNSCRVIITTNQTIDRIDSALVRPGRCFDFITLPPLSFEEGKNIWINKFNMDPSMYDTLYGGMTEVTQAALISDYERCNSETKVRRYIKNGPQDYSILNKLQDIGVLESKNYGFGK